jgi:hypothetical protein
VQAAGREDIILVSIFVSKALSKKARRRRRRKKQQILHHSNACEGINPSRISEISRISLKTRHPDVKIKSFPSITAVEDELLQ